MPHLVLEYSSNIIEENGFIDFFERCHLLLAKALPTDISSCKSRAIKYEYYQVGEGHSSNAFVHVSIRVLPGRDLIKLKNLSNEILDILKNYLVESTKKCSLNLSVEVSELNESYVKFSSRI